MQPSECKNQLQYKQNLASFLQKSIPQTKGGILERNKFTEKQLAEKVSQVKALTINLLPILASVPAKQSIWSNEGLFIHTGWYLVVCTV